MLPSPPPGFADLALIGQGATSRVYRAYDRKAKREVALKRLHRQLIRDEETLARMQRELEALGQLSHPSIVAVLGVISWQGDPTIVMEVIEGEDLREHILGRGGLGGPETERIGRALLEALAAAHAVGIVHRDVKPQNIRLAKDGRVVLLDFGSARLDAASALTATGTTVGTPEYMAPELFVAPSYDPRGDLYGVGATLFECLAGRPPFLADSLAELAFAKSSRAAPPIAELVPSCPVALSLLIDRCLARAPDERFASAARALWTLDHPAAERLLAERRRAEPLCLHCGAAIGAGSRVCPACGSGHPFAYRGGRVDVFLVGLDDEAKLVDYLLSRYPERATPKRLRALVRSIHGVSKRKQRLISMIDEREAAELVRELAEIDVRATIAPSRGTATIALAAGLCAGLLTSAVLGALEVHGSFLPLFTGPLMVLLVLGGAMLRRPREILGPGPTPRLVRPELPQPGWRGRFIAVVGGGRLPARFVGPSLGDRALTRITFSLGLALIPVELWAIDAIGLGAAVVQAPARGPAIGRAPPRIPERPPAPPPSASVSPMPSAPPSPPARSAQQARSPRGTARQQQREVPLLPFALGAVTLAAIGGLVLTRRRSARELIELEGALDLPRLLAGPHKEAPHDRRPATQRERLLAPPPGDAFVISQRVTASTLAAGLAPEDRALLSGALSAVEKSAPLAQIEQASLHARALRETDPDQQLRFELLQLMGEMEAKAALAWAEALEARSKAR